MPVFVTGFCIGLCLCLAGGITIIRTAFARLTEKDFPSVQGDSAAYHLFKKMVSRQDRIFSSLSVAYGFFITCALMLMARYLLAGFGFWLVALHGVVLPCLIVLLTDMWPRAWMLGRPAEDAIRLFPWIMRVASVFHGPAVLLAALARGLFRFRGGLFNTAESYASVSRFYESGQADTSPEKQDYTIQRSLSRLAATPVSHMMIPVRQLLRIDAALEAEELMAKCFDTTERRILLYQDEPENIAGILHVSLLMKSFCMADGDRNTTDITSAISGPVFIAPDKTVLAQLQDFATRQDQFVLVRDDRGIVQGAIDLETILESLVDKG